MRIKNVFFVLQGLLIWLSRSSFGAKKSATWRIFSLQELHSATNNFNYDNKLGEGGFGSVYWGQLANGDQVRYSSPVHDNPQELFVR